MSRSSRRGHIQPADPSSGAQGGPSARARYDRGRSRLLTTDTIRDALVVSVCDSADEDSAHGTAHLHWSVPDPVGQPRSAFMDAFDTIEDRVEQLSRSDTGGFMNDVPTRRSGLTLDQQLALRTAAGRLQERFDGVFSTETLERFLHHSYDEFADRAAVAQWLPLMARFAHSAPHCACPHRRARFRLRPVVLFLCVHNAGRSQMALGFFRKTSPETV